MRLGFRYYWELTPDLKPERPRLPKIRGTPASGVTNPKSIPSNAYIAVAIAMI